MIKDWVERHREKRRLQAIFGWIFLLLLSIGLFAMGFTAYSENRQLAWFFVICGAITLVLTIICLRAHIIYVKNYIALNGTERIVYTIKICAVILAISAVVIALVFAVATVVNRLAA